MTTLVMKLQSTGAVLGTLTFDGAAISCDTLAAEDIVATRRRRGMDDLQIWAQLDGWSNGYLTFERRPE